KPVRSCTGIRRRKRFSIIRPQLSFAYSRRATTVRMLFRNRVLRDLQILLLFAGSTFCPACFAFTDTPSEFLRAVGDAPDVAPPLASDLSPEDRKSTRLNSSHT